MSDMPEPIKIAPCKPFLVSLPGGGITEGGLQEVKVMLIDALRGQIADIHSEARDTLEILGDEWMVTKGKYAGTYPKRLAKHLKIKYDYKIDPQLLGTVGEILKRNTSEANEYVLDFTDQFDWHDGDFHDEDSCYWGSNSGAKPMIQSAGGLAVRFYDVTQFNEHDYLRGIGRAWLLPVTKTAHWCVFNGYGMGLQTVTIARILATITGTSYKRIYMTNRGSSDGMLWINGGKAYIVGEWGEIANTDRVDHDIPSMDGEDERAYCCNCDYGMHPDDAYIVDYDYYCHSCYNDFFIYCERCHTDQDRGSSYVVQAVVGNGRRTWTVCEGCFDNTGFICEECEEPWIQGNGGMTEIAGMCLCPDCAEQAHECDWCGDVFLYAPNTRIETPRAKDGRFLMGTLRITICDACNTGFKLDDFINEKYHPVS